MSSRVDDVLHEFFARIDGRLTLAADLEAAHDGEPTHDRSARREAIADGLESDFAAIRALIFSSPLQAEVASIAAGADALESGFGRLRSVASNDGESCEVTLDVRESDGARSRYDDARLVLAGVTARVDRTRNVPAVLRTNDHESAKIGLVALRARAAEHRNHERSTRR